MKRINRLMPFLWIMVIFGVSLYFPKHDPLRWVVLGSLLVGYVFGISAGWQFAVTEHNIKKQKDLKEQLTIMGYEGRE